MGRFVVGVDAATGLKTIDQVATEDDVARMKAADGIEAEIDNALDADLRSELERDLSAGDDDGPPADAVANKLMAGLHEQNSSWAKKLAAKIATPEGVSAALLVEAAHPKFKDNDPPGRRSVIEALAERGTELAREAALAHSPGGLPSTSLEAPGPGIPCEHCDFVAGSEKGLAQHVATHHSGEDAGP